MANSGCTKARVPGFGSDSGPDLTYTEPSRDDRQNQGQPEDPKNRTSEDTARDCTGNSDQERHEADSRSKFLPAAAPRPQRTWRESIFHTLPPYTGPYPVGYLEIEVPAQEPRHFSHIKRNHEYALKLDTVLFSVYYPCESEEHRKARTAKETEKMTSPPSLSRPPWLPRPRIQTCKGYAKFFSIPDAPVTAYMSLTSMFTELPAFRNAQLSDEWPSTFKDDEERETEKQPPGSGPGEAGQSQDDRATDDQDRGKPKSPLVIFSHGLGGSRTMYSSICGELASFGFVVVAMEHRDGSGARTYVNKVPGNSESPDLDSQDLDRGHEPPRSSSPGNNQETQTQTTTGKSDPNKNKPYYMVDYIFPKDNAQDTSPHNARGVDTELRGAQIEMRLAEIEEAFHVMGMIQSGQGSQVAEQNLRRKGNIGSSSKGLDGINWEEWKGRLYMSDVTLMGHSFGGATTVQALRLGSCTNTNNSTDGKEKEHMQRFSWVSQGILLDPWGPAVPVPDKTNKQKITKPILSIGSEAFMHWTENFNRVTAICREAQSSSGSSAVKIPVWMTTIRGSTHLSQTDFAVLYPNWISLLMKTIVNPQRAIAITVHSALEFLKIVLPNEQTRFNQHWVDERLLLGSTSSRRRGKPGDSTSGSDSDGYNSSATTTADGNNGNSSETETAGSFDHQQLSQQEDDQENYHYHRPDDKWVAARLKIPNEFSLRLRSWWSRRRRWRKKRLLLDKDDPNVARDASGKPLAGLLNWGAGKEIWVHLSPPPDSPG